jgi:hypothetical protein
VTTIRVIASTIVFASFGLAQAAPAAIMGRLELREAPLAYVIDGLARQLGINYVLDTRLANGVSITTHSDSHGADARDVLEVILRGTRAEMIETARGQLQIPVFRIERQLPESGEPSQTVLHLVFLKDMTADRLSELMAGLAGQGRVEVVRNAASRLLVIRSRIPPAN